MTYEQQINCSYVQPYFFCPSIISYVFCFFTYKIVFSLFILRNLQILISLVKNKPCKISSISFFEFLISSQSYAFICKSTYIICQNTLCVNIQIYFFTCKFVKLYGFTCQKCQIVQIFAIDFAILSILFLLVFLAIFAFLVFLDVTFMVCKFSVIFQLFFIF